VLITTQKPIAVEVVGERGLHDLLGPALLAIAAILAAGLAAYVAVRNHRAQLAHNRTERDREHARESIRAAAETIAETLDPLGAYELAVRANDKAEKHVEALTGSDDEHLKQEATEQQLQRAKEVRQTRERSALF